MNKKVVICIFAICICLVAVLTINPKQKVEKTSSVEGTVLEVSKSYVKISGDGNIIYTFMIDADETLKVGDNVRIKYDGELDKSKENQSAKILSCTTYELDNEMLSSWDDNGMFSEFYEMAYTRLKTMSTDEKIGQIFLVRVPEENKISDLEKYKFGGYLLFERDFKDKTKDEVIKMIDEFQNASKIPLLIATDEEGGKVSRISSNTNLVDTPFKSPSELYKEGGMELIKQDTINKTETLEDLGINVNLAPVVDVATDPDSYMYERTIKEDTEITSEYAKTVIDASKSSKVSYTLKHFPGYGDNADTHEGSSTDNRTYSALFENDIPPFKAGIKEGAEAVLVSHNTVPALDKDNPASLSVTTHNVLRNDLSFTGIIITDDLEMKAVNEEGVIVKAIKAGNDLLIVTDYESAISEVKKNLENGNLNETLIDKIAFRVLAWKYYKGLMYDIEK